MPIITRKFDGKNFSFVDYFRLKSEAMAKAKKLRAAGKMARVSPEAKGYVVYARNG
jgi:hypothetical protein